MDHDDIPLQKIECRKFAQNHGWRVVAEAAEKGISGSKVSASKRDVIQKLREEAEKKTFDILLVYMFDRLGRIDSETPSFWSGLSTMAFRCGAPTKDSRGLKITLTS